MLGLLVSPAYALCPGCFYDSGFEAPLTWNGTTNTEGWTGWSGPCAVVGAPTQCMTITNSPVQSGAGALNMHFACVGLTQVPACNPNGGGNNISRRHPGTTHVFGRMMFRLGPGFQIGDNLHSKILYHQGQLGYPMPVVDLTNGKYTLDLQITYDDNVIAPQLVSNKAPSSTSWDLVEWEMKLNSVVNGVANNDGYIRFWVNNVLIIESLNRRLIGPTDTSKDPRFGSPTPANFVFDTMKFYNQSGYGDMYIDRVAAGTQRIGAPDAAPLPPDAQAPTVPSNLRAQAVSSSQINLTWNASTDNVGVTGYKISRAGAQIDTTTSTSYSNTALNASTAYSYTVAAYDAGGNASAPSATGQHHDACGFDWRGRHGEQSKRGRGWSKQRHSELHGSHRRHRPAGQVRYPLQLQRDFVGRGAFRRARHLCYAVDGKRSGCDENLRSFGIGAIDGLSIPAGRV